MPNLTGSALIRARFLRMLSIILEELHAIRDANAREAVDSWRTVGVRRF